jgi:hypothetical protein
MARRAIRRAGRDKGRSMTKARTKAKRRRRSNFINLPGGQSIAQRATQGRRADLNPAEPVDALALSTRARLTGCTVEEARDVLAGEDMGRCIRYLHPAAQDRRGLLNVWQALCATWHNYAIRCLGRSISAQGSTIPVLPDPMQTDPSLRVDLRTADEKDAAARDQWFARLEAIMSLPENQRHALRGHLQGYGAPVWDADATRPTRAGVLAVKALEGLREK